LFTALQQLEYDIEFVGVFQVDMEVIFVEESSLFILFVG